MRGAHVMRAFASIMWETLGEPEQRAVETANAHPVGTRNPEAYDARRNRLIIMACMVSSHLNEKDWEDLERLVAATSGDGVLGQPPADVLPSGPPAAERAPD